MDRLVAEQEKQLGFTVANKPHFDKMHVSGTCCSFLCSKRSTDEMFLGTVRKGMQRTDGTILELTKILVDKCPEDLKPEAEALDKRAKGSFEKCLKAYSDAKGGEDLVDDKADFSD